MDTKGTTTYMLWFEESKCNLTGALRRASEHYHKKHGRWPTLALVPRSWANEAAEIQENWKRQNKDGIVIKVQQNVLPRHLMLTHMHEEGR